MDYIGEHLLPGQLGQFFITLSLVASLAATFSYFKATRSATAEIATPWKRLARTAFLIEVFSVLAVFCILFYIIYNHLFEYHYAWKHSSLSLEFKYLLACFWEGQEGSFLLWSIWHCVLGLILMRTSKQWEAPVMTVISFAQVCLATMIAGIYLFHWKLGSSPFILLRHSPVLDNVPVLHLNFDVNQPLKQDYLSSIKDGNDLNPLLQNYWMVIHPPVLFMGFASTIVPFAFAFAGLWKKNFTEWTRPALPWALFSAAVLGVGIMMGAMWAYESLTFGGYWAWDPVENASLVPWMVMIAGVHTLLIYKHSGHSLRSTHLFFILSFGLVLYSTFLTRTGVLGDASVHAFTGEGNNLTYHLLSFMGLMLIPAFILYIRNHRKIPFIQKEESGSSREFWMFIGSLVLFLSAIVIILKTSLPVLNIIMKAASSIFSFKFLDKAIAAPQDPEYAYNLIQVYVAIIIAILTGLSQYLKYKETSARFFWKKIWLPTLISVIAATLVLGFGEVNYAKQGIGFEASIWLAVACSIYAIIANASYIWLGMKGNLKLSGGSIAHFGFGIVLLGILISSSKKEILSYNTSGIAIDFGDDKKQRAGENLTLVKGLPTTMGNYWVTYERDSAHPKKQLWYYQVRFKRKDGKEEFVLHPDAFVNYKGNEGLMANPDSRHYWDHDVFTYITSLPNPAKAEKEKAVFRPVHLKAGDTAFYSNGYMILEKLNSVDRDSLPKDVFGEDGSLYEAPLKVFSKTGSRFSVTPRLAIARGSKMMIPDTLISENLVLQVQGVNSDQSIDLGLQESNEPMQYITLKAYKFPFINLLWLGVVITASGILISMVRRIRLNRQTLTKS